MTLKRIALAMFIPLLCVAGFFLYRAYCPMPSPASQNDDPAAIIGELYLYQASLPF